MKTKASILTLRIPRELKHKIEQISNEQGISINQLALYALTKETMEMDTSNFFAKYWVGKTKKEIMNDFDDVMKNVGMKKLPNWDKI